MRIHVMFKLFCILLAIVFIVSSFLTMGVAAEEVKNNSVEEKVYCSATKEDAFVDNAVLIKFKNIVSLKCNSFTIKDFPEINVKSVRSLTEYVDLQIREINQSILSAASRGIVPNLNIDIDLSSFHQVLRIELEDCGKDKVLSAIKSLEKREDILYVCPDYYLTYCSENIEESSYTDAFENSWAYYQIQLDKAWEEMPSDAGSVMVGVIDTGIYGNHPELSSSIYGNYCDSFDELVYPNALSDIDGHGTQVAGIIKGVARNVQLISLKISDGGYGTSSAAFDAIMYATRKNIPILNLSWSWMVDDGEETGYYYTDILTDAIDCYGDTGGLIVCAAGNEAADIDDDNDEYDYYPAQHARSNMIVVGASTETDGIQENSNYGAYYVDVFAPGDNITTTTNSGGMTNSAYLSSMATPFVTGLAAMILMANDELTAENIASIIRETVDTVNSSNLDDEPNPEIGDDIEDLYTACYSKGRINAYKAILAANECQHNGNTYYTSNGALTHSERCSDCYAKISNESHTLTYASSGSSGHLASCSLCDYSDTVAHNFYVVEIYDGDNGCDIACRDCSYSFHCDCNPEYGGGDATGHYAACPDGYYSLFEAHNYGQYTDLENGNHSATCVDCGYVYTAQHFLYRAESETENALSHIIGCLLCEYKSTEAHTWVSAGLGYRCTVCGMLSDAIPSIMSLPDPELEAYLASLSDEELEEFIASLPEDQVERVTALLPSDDEHLTE